MIHSWRHRRGLAAIASLMLAAAALLAFAGPASAHHHDSGSGNPTGTISSFDPDSGVLTIDLAGGGQVSGFVTDETSIATSGSGCHHGDSGEETSSRHGRKSRALRHNFDGHARGWHHGRWHHGDDGSTDDLVAGAAVTDAVLILADGQATFVKVDLAG
jgi:hypothetical protein